MSQSTTPQKTKSLLLKPVLEAVSQNPTPQPVNPARQWWPVFALFTLSIVISVAAAANTLAGTALNG
jgi:hypothetical protein